MKRAAGKSARAGDHRSNSGKDLPVGITIRKAATKDLPDVVAMSAGVQEIENYPGQEMKADDFRHFIRGRDTLMLVAIASDRKRKESEVVGYVTAYRLENYFYLPYAVTKKGWRHRGVGGVLLAEVERLAKERKVEYILTTVYSNNSAVHRFLKVRGYVPSTRLVQYSKIVTNKGKR